MSETDTTRPPPRRPRLWRPVLVGVVLAGVAVTATTYAARRSLAREALTGWLRDQGVESEVSFKAFDADGLSGSLRIGPARDPDLVAEVAEVRYDILGFWEGQPLGVRVTQVRLVEPSIKARWRDGKLSLGSLDPLIEKLRRRPPQPDRGQPTIEIDSAHLRLDTDYGRLTAIADLSADKGRLRRLDARVAPAALKTRDAEIRLGASELHVVAFGNRLAVAAALQAERLRAGDLSADGSSLRLSAQTPYPDLKLKTADGDVSVNLTLDARSLARGTSRVRNLRQTASFRGAASGWIDRLTLKGSGEAAGLADELVSGGSTARAVQVRARAGGLTWSHAGGDRVTADLNLAVGADRLAASRDLTLTRIAGAFDGPAAAGGGDYRLDLSGALKAHGGWAGLGPARPGDTPGDRGLKRAMSAFDVDAPRIAIRATNQNLVLSLPAAARLRPDNGGQIVLLPTDRPLYADGAGGFRLTAGGGSLPTTDLSVARYRVTGGGVDGQARLAVRGSLGPVERGSVELAGGFRMSHGAFEIAADGCAPISAERLELGVNDIEALSGSLCPGGGPLVRIGGGGWRVKGVAKDAGVRVPFLEAQVSRVSGPIELADAKGDLGLVADIRAARIDDLAKAQRFRPLLAHGTATLAAETWRGAFALTDPAGRPLAQARLDHDGRSGAGGLTFDTGTLAFAEGGLQPANLSPLAADIGSPASGQARFQGSVDWTAAGSTSHGTLDVGHLDFRSRAGAVKGLTGQVVLTSLAPLRSAPGQTLRAESVVGLAPLSAAEVRFSLDEKAIQVGAASFTLSGGKVTVEPFAIPLTPAASWHAVVDLDGVELSDLVKASPFADRMNLVARVSGQVPFAVTPQGVRVSGGELHAITPGRLSIRREALTQVTADGGAPATGAKAAPAPAAAADPYSDFVYQAMESLAFNELNARVDSQAGGRLRVLFHIKGEHSPPTRQTIQLAWGEVIRRRIDRIVPLPSGTKVDLTLDTSVNLDQLLSDFAEYQRLRGSGPVQPKDR
ncbi:MAG TPA: YdbH domain-containing protein [Phenylobacterium sp.]|nr:YdbH domain-containing protein [Phenylobacterium sp.]